MSTTLLLIEISVFGGAFWLGSYLIGRDFGDAVLRYAGLGLFAYSATIAVDLLQVQATGHTNAGLIRLQWILVVVPALFWAMTMIHLLPVDSMSLLPVTGSRVLLGLVIGVVVGASLVNFAGDTPRPGFGYALSAGLMAVILGGLVLLVLYAARQKVLPPPARQLLLVGALFFGLGVGLLLLPLDWLPRSWLVVGIGADMVLFGLAIAVFDAFAQGETLALDMRRSFLASLGMAAIFGGQVGLVMVIETGITPAMTALLLSVLGAAILIATQADWFSTLLDRLVFSQQVAMHQERQELRQLATALPRVGTMPPEITGEAEFIRLTRRALSNFGNLPRLASSPLARLPLVDVYLQAHGRHDNTLERAAALKAILAASIERLKPRQQGNFGTSAEWRHYNVLYYPYVLGIKPFGHYLNYQDDPGCYMVLEWFRAEVPERTFYNWQNAATRLVALDLREQMAENSTPRSQSAG